MIFIGLVCITRTRAYFCSPVAHVVFYTDQAARSHAQKNQPSMSCFTFYVFNRQGVCQYYHEWVKATKPAGDENGISEDFKLMFGLCWSLKAFAGAIDPKRWEASHCVDDSAGECLALSSPCLLALCSGRKRSMGTPARIGDGCGFRSFKTESYKLHFLESPSGMKVRAMRQAGRVAAVVAMAFSGLY